MTSTTLPLSYSRHISEALATVAGCEKSAGLTPCTPLLEGWRRVASAHRPEDSRKRWRGAKSRRASGVHAGCLYRRPGCAAGSAVFWSALAPAAVIWPQAEASRVPVSQCGAHRLAWTRCGWKEVAPKRSLSEESWRRAPSRIQSLS